MRSRPSGPVCWQAARLAAEPASQLGLARTGRASAGANEASSAQTNTDGGRLSGHPRDKLGPDQHGQGAPQRTPVRHNSTTIRHHNSNPLGGGMFELWI